MSIISIVNDYVCQQVALKTFDALVSSTDPTARDIVTAATEAGKIIAGRAEWTKLSQSTTLAGGSSTYNLPADFHRLTEGGSVVLNGATHVPILPVTSAEKWQFLAKQPSSQAYYRLNKGNGSIEFSPTLAASGAVLNYVSKDWVNSNASVFTNDTDNPVFPDELFAKAIVYRYKQNKRQSYQDYETEFEAMLEREIKADRGIS